MHRQYTFFNSGKVWLPVVFFLAFCACGPKASSIHGNTEGYDLDHPTVIELPTSLNELSGLWYYAKDSSLFAIEDEEGFLYKIFPKRPNHILRWKFHGHGDFEDVCMHDSTFYILRSDGAVFVTNIRSGDSIESVKYEVPEKGNEFESIYYDDSLRLVMIVCKDCVDDKKKNLSTWGFDPVSRQFVQAPFEIDVKNIASIMGESSIRFKPSAATINPFTNQLMLVSSVNKLLVIAKRDGTVLQAYPLAPGIYKQPEGIAISADRTLYISNESAGQGSANILVMPYHNKSK